MLSRKLIGSLFISVVLAGCTKTTSPISSSTSSAGNVTMSAVFSNLGTPIASENAISAKPGIDKVNGTTSAVDSIRIDSAIVVLANIQFESDIDTVTVDTSSSIPFISIDDNNSRLIFPGPFVVHVSDTVQVSFASDTLPAGTYTGIKLAIRTLGPGDRRWDSDDFNHMPGSSADSSTTNYSIVVWGAVYKDTAWVPFELKDNQNLQIKVKGTFTIPTPTSSVNIALNFDMGNWFINPINGNILDPTNGSLGTYIRIQQAIAASFNNGRCGRWDDFQAWGFGHGR